jgi:outer membrane protein
MNSKNLKEFFMKKYFLSVFLSSALLSTGAFATDASPTIGIVNFTTCITDSKLGKQEQTSFDALKKQLGTLLEDTEKQLTEINNKMNDPEFMDGLSPEGEEELKVKFQTLNEEMGRYQNQYYQVLNQANMRIVQMLQSSIATAAEKVAKEKKLGMVVNKDACFFYAPQSEVTSLVIAEMDRVYEIESKKQPQAPALPAANTQKAEAPKNETKTQ